MEDPSQKLPRAENSPIPHPQEGNLSARESFAERGRSRGKSGLGVLLLFGTQSQPLKPLMKFSVCNLRLSQP